MSHERPFYPEELEKKVEEYALEFLLKGRKEWDEPHTRAVVYYAESIARANDLDVLVLKTTAWLHDIGYFAMFENTDSKNYDSVMDKKAMHMVNGAKLADKFLSRPEIKTYYSDEQKERIIYLVSVHDKIEELAADDEVALMEADTLGAIDISKVATTFDKENAIKYVEKDLMGRRYPKFRTELGKKYFSELITPFKAQFGI
jgi:putative nucleotidyltransferase with HDIG domain